MSWQLLVCSGSIATNSEIDESFRNNLKKIMKMKKWASDSGKSMKTELSPITFKVAYFKVIGKSLICPDNAPEVDETVIGFYPLKKVDPLDKYAFVITKSGETVTASKKFLKRLAIISIPIELKKLETANQLTERKLKIMRELIECYNIIKMRLNQRKY